MIKFSLKFTTFIFLFLSNVAHSGLIKSELTQDNYVTIGGLDWTWASAENASWASNTIYTPDSIDSLNGWDRKGWRHAESSELLIFINNRDIADFSYLNASNELVYKNSFVFWNTAITEVSDIDVDGFNAGLIETYLVGDNNTSSWAYETFYVRNTPAQVPEPTTIMIFAIALIALSMRNRVIQ
ncbi:MULTISPECIES: PEP-CTERM sorting domain-containing protein [unclassified Colwellia]|jgi:hypothetical protein|uniref:PEP-CTERM sorting domain-containing protein n=1 Tax=unclassified Colwellia TaxID=196834 RepID=UPI0015F4F0D7|nr:MULTISPECIES: PEP-CTERM sorting domain-containing protein [unclassified Colwellia]MBA6355964.1 PEP-CTERM sorting domain-containing protein [Colwellia sp. BRX8-3]MBA6359626.1 PEP-CTERM sorting domain-containing protein [Colwellia sp. BRX8-6]MBA6366213.1 PEP-CTERM sorting domain-containing protein [Colwellia sp. BRX8-5]MBA6374627.1 PEP-CTERM sorting domain-containing protein [Colwellia sp. BRX8-2]MBA6382709.1 PEP-CTERM sorting domain-containing protein [Colwellia sp. BRX10-9]